jgi:hypothetical protein
MPPQRRCTAPLLRCFTRRLAVLAAAEGAELFLGNAGTAMRPLTAAVAAAGRGRFVLDGVPRMRERPIQDLVDGLVQVAGGGRRGLGGVARCRWRGSALAVMGKDGVGVAVAARVCMLAQKTGAKGGDLVEGGGLTPKIQRRLLPWLSLTSAGAPFCPPLTHTHSWASRRAAPWALAAPPWRSLRRACPRARSLSAAPSAAST